MSEEFDQAYWEDRYREHGTAAHHSAPNPQLLAEVADLPPGTALDAGCGEGADAIWLASKGWRVTAVDIATTALDRARKHAEPLGPDVTGRIDWLAADLTTWTPTKEHFDLVSTHYVHLAGPLEDFFGRLAAAVAPGGTLLIVGHDHADPHTAHTSAPDAHFTAERVVAGLVPDRWEIAVAETRTRTVARPGGHERELHDTVVRARRRST